MKKRMLLSVFLISYFVTNGQNIIHHSFESSYGFEEKFKLKKNDLGFEIIIDVNKSLSAVNFNFKCLLDKGNLIATILDPNGKKEGGFELEAKVFSESKRNINSVNGDMKKQIKNPLYGKWLIKISLIEAEGALSISAESKL